MLEQSNTKINFAGRDGFNWFIGQVTADAAWRDKNNQNFQNGFRAKVRILGVHPAESKDEGGIDDEDLPWAHFLVSPQFGAGHNWGGTSFALQGGETVWGFFLDGDEGQQPVVVGCFYANTSIEAISTWEDVLKNKSSGFGPFTADKSIEVGKHIAPTHDGRPAESGTVPNSSSKVIESKVIGKDGLKTENQTTEEYLTKVRGSLDEHNTLDTINKHYDNKVYKTKVAQKCIAPAGAMGEVTKALQSFTDVMSGLEKFEDGYIDPVINKIVDVDLLVEKAANKIAGGFSATIRSARQELFKEIEDKVNGSINFLDPSHLIKNLEVKKEQDSIYCLIENVINGLKNFVGDFLKGMLGNLLQFPLCAAEQFLGGLISGIKDKIQGLISPAISAISSIGNISLPSFGGMMDKALGIAQVGLALLSCEGNECEPEPMDWITNVGADPKIKLDIGRMKGLASGLSALGGLKDAIKDPMGALGGMFPGIGKITGAISSVKGIVGSVSTLKSGLSGGISGGMSSLVGGCDPFTKNCGSPKLSIFGGGGAGAAGKAVINSIGEVVGVSMDSLGSGFTSKPFVTITDNCDNGKGATAIVDIDLDENSPNFGQVKDVIITNPGGGYVGPGVIDTIIDPDTGEEVETPTGTTTLPDGTVAPIQQPDNQSSSGEGEDVIGEVTGIQVVNTGTGYKDGDTIITSNGSVIIPKLDSKGRIVGAENVKVDLGLTSIPKLSINTDTGFGAIIRPITKFTKKEDYKDPIVPEAKLIRVIDCPRGF